MRGKEDAGVNCTGQTDRLDPIEAEDTIASTVFHTQQVLLATLCGPESSYLIGLTCALNLHN